MRTGARLLLAIAATGAAIRAQTPPAFDVVSVKPSVPRATGRRGGGGTACAQTFNMDRERLTIRCATVDTLIAHAYRLPSRVTRPAGPDWIGAQGPKFDIEATLPTGATESHVPEMLQAMLADRFKLAVHRTTTEQEVYALQVAKGGPKLKEADAAAAPADDPNAAPAPVVAVGGVATRMTRLPNGYVLTNARIGTARITIDSDRISHLEAPDTTMEGLVSLLVQVGPLSQDIIDMTDVKGRYQVSLAVSLNDPTGPLPAEARGDRAAMEAAVLDRQNAMVRSMNSELQKVGLQLTRRKGPVETVVVDHVERPSAN